MHPAFALPTFDAGGIRRPDSSEGERGDAVEAVPAMHRLPQTAVVRCLPLRALSGVIFAPLSRAAMRRLSPQVQAYAAHVSRCWR
jgi:hypothetical protein